MLLSFVSLITIRGDVGPAMKQFLFFAPRLLQCSSDFYKTLTKHFTQVKLSLISIATSYNFLNLIYCLLNNF